MTETTIILEAKGLTKRFPGVLANDKVNFDLRQGEIHALLGENGAGKSTLMNLLYGLYRQDEGEIFVDGRLAEIHSPNDAIDLGIDMVHQHFMLIPVFTVTENVMLGEEVTRRGVLDRAAVAARIKEISSQYGLEVDPEALVGDLPVGVQQRVEILKTLYRNAKILILDEPTAVLTPQEVDELFVIMKQMTRDGHALIFISHKLHEVVEISSRVTVLRDGRKIGTRPTSETSKQDLANWMVGREVGFAPDRGHAELGETRLQLEDVHCGSDRGAPGLRGVSLDVRSGEILGIAGVSGNGQRELAETITGLRKVASGRVQLEGQEVANLPPGELTERMLSYIPEERMRDGMIKEFTVAENLILREHQKQPYSRNGFLDLNRIASHADQLIREFNVKTPSRDTLAKNLSGGNIQKVALARELSRSPRVIIAAQPTRGLDIGATEYVRAQLIEQRRRGAAVMLISEDLDEILAISDRIAVLYEGRVMDIVPRGNATPEKLGLLMAGVHPEDRVSDVK